MKKTEKYIVKGHANTNEHANVLFLMDKTDYRFGLDYEPVTLIDRRVPVGRTRANNGYSMLVYTGTDGKQYGVFADGSARCLSR